MKNNSVKNISRRQFIQQGAVATGAFVVGMHLPTIGNAAIASKN